MQSQSALSPLDHSQASTSPHRSQKPNLMGSVCGLDFDQSLGGGGDGEEGSRNTVNGLMNNHLVAIATVKKEGFKGLLGEFDSVNSLVKSSVAELLSAAGIRGTVNTVNVSDTRYTRSTTVKYEVTICPQSPSDGHFHALMCSLCKVLTLKTKEQDKF